MSRTQRRPYTGASRFSTGCRCHGSCKWCFDNRTHKHARGATASDWDGTDDGTIWTKRDELEYEIYRATQLYSDEIFAAWKAGQLCHPSKS